MFLKIKNIIGDFITWVLKNFAPSKIYLSWIYWLSFHYFPNFKNPKTFNEKLQCIKLYDHNPLYTKCADKLLVRDYVREKIGDKYLINLMAVFERPEDIDLDLLPDKFAMKLNTGSSCNIICKDKSKLIETDIKKQFTKWYKFKFYKRYKEVHYKPIVKRIICEELLENHNGDPIFDWKFFCFNGEPYILMVDMGESHSGCRNIYNMDWTRHPGYITHPQDYNFEVEKPSKFDEMIDVVRKLAADFYEVRVDLYLVNNVIYFGELTFTSGGGFLPFSSYEFDLEMGKQFNVPTKNLKNE